MIQRFLVLFAVSMLWSHTAAAQVDFSGNWRSLARNQDGSGLTGDAAGVPITDGARARAHSWSPEEFDVAEWVCRPHAWDYSLEGPLSQLRLWADVEQATQQVIAYRGHVNMMEQETTIWVDGRPHPPAHAVHTWSGFSTGEWDGNDLVVTTTHKKEAYIRRTGLMHSDQAISRTRWRRIGNYLQATVIIYDPVYLTDPYIRSTMMWVNDPGGIMQPYPCEEATETAVPRGSVPNFLPGQNPLPGLDPDLADKFTTPYEAKLGGTETMYPEFIKKMKTFKVPTKKATEADLGQ